jgi:TRAP-type mannitol/chloroaromatic compound transport system permease small subunit
MNTFLKLVDTINTYLGRAAALIIPIIMIIVFTEVVMRYLFNSPTIWAWDINIQLFALVVLLSGGFTLLNKGHVNIDLLYGRLSTRQRAWLDVITAPVFFLFMGILVWKLGVMAVQSVEEREVMSTILAPPIYPMKVIVTIGTFLFFLQGVVALIRNIRIIARKDN